MSELPILQKAYDLICWFVPILNRLPRDQKLLLGDRMITLLYELLEGLVIARYASQKITILESIKSKPDVLRYQTRLLLDFGLISVKRYEYATHFLVEIGNDLGGWIQQQKRDTR